MSEPIRWLIPAILLIAVAGVAVALWWEGRHPSVYPGSAAHRAALESVEDGTAPNLAAWAQLSTEEQAAHDAAALEASAAAERAAEEAARLVVERARVNALYHP